MSLEQIREKIKRGWIVFQIKRVFSILLQILICIVVFGIIKQIAYLEALGMSNNDAILLDKYFKSAEYEPYGQFKGAKFVASISGKRFYPVGCKASNRIKESNRVYFKSQEDAQLAGYTPALNC